MNKLKNNNFIKNNQIFINFNSNAWSTTAIMIDRIEKIYFTYIKMDSLWRSGLLISDKANSHIKEEVIEKCIVILMGISILPGGCTIIIQSLDISINRQFKVI